MCLTFEQISAYLDGELSEKEESLVSEHLKECSNCNVKFKNLKILIQAIKTLKEPDISVNFVSEVMKKLNQTCPSFETLSSYVDNEFSLWNYREILEHLKYCDKCNIILHNIKTIIKLIGKLPNYSFSGGFVYKVIDNLEKQCLTNEQLSAYLDEEVNPDEKEIFKQHISSCSKCSNRLSNLKILTKSVNSLPVVIKVSDNFIDNIFDKIDKLQSCISSENLSSYVDNSIDSEDEKSKIESHITVCSKCSTRFKNLKNIKKAISLLENIEVNEKFVTDILEKLSESKQKKDTIIKFWNKLKVKSSLAAGFITLLGILVSIIIFNNVNSSNNISIISGGGESSIPVITVKGDAEDMLFNDQNYGGFELNDDISVLLDNNSNNNNKSNNNGKS